MKTIATCRPRVTLRGSFECVRTILIPQLPRGQPMARPAKRARGKSKRGRGRPSAYEQAQQLALAGDVKQSRRVYCRLLRASEAKLAALAHNDLAAIAAVDGRFDEARSGFEAALALDPSCTSAQHNLLLLRGQLESAPYKVEVEALDGRKSPVPISQSIRVAILSFLFNWPSTGGGIIHTVELAKFLSQAGFDVQHFSARNTEWGVGRVQEALPIRSQAIGVDARREWNAASIQEAFRRAVRSFDPDYVIITDSWNFKPLLAEAVKEYPYILRQQALECLCPLNNLRLLVGPDRQVRQCGLHQLATATECGKCVDERGHLSGALHQAERALSGFGTEAYLNRLKNALQGAEAVLVLNPLVKELLSPYAREVRVATWGMDASRFPWPWPEETARKERTVLFMAGVVEEMIKGFHVLQEACARLWRRRQDFELVATGEPAGQINAFTRFVGWISQADLPRHLRAADIVVMPTIAQEGLGRSTVEAMAVGRPVVASRIGGLPFTVHDGATGLLAEPGNAEDLASKIEALLDDAGLRERMGLAGRKVFEENFTWPKVIERDYRPLLTRRRCITHAGNQ